MPAGTCTRRLAALLQAALLMLFLRRLRLLVVCCCATLAAQPSAYPNWIELRAMLPTASRPRQGVLKFKPAHDEAKFLFVRRPLRLQCGWHRLPTNLDLALPRTMIRKRQAVGDCWRFDRWAGNSSCSRPVKRLTQRRNPGGHCGPNRRWNGQMQALGSGFRVWGSSHHLPPSS